MDNGSSGPCQPRREGAVTSVAWVPGVPGDFVTSEKTGVLRRGSVSRSSARGDSEAASGPFAWSPSSATRSSSARVGRRAPWALCDLRWSLVDDVDGVGDTVGAGVGVG